jgi:hypothetical protein
MATPALELRRNLGSRRWYPPKKMLLVYRVGAGSNGPRPI